MRLRTDRFPENRPLFFKIDFGFPQPLDILKIVGLRTAKFLSSYPGSSYPLRDKIVDERVGELLSRLRMMQITTANKHFLLFQMAL